MTIFGMRDKLSDLKEELIKHDARLAQHCKQTDMRLKGELRERIKRLYWWVEFHRRLNFLHVSFSVFLAELALVRPSIGQWDTRERRREGKKLVERYQQSLNDLLLHAKDSKKYERDRSDDKHGEEEAHLRVSNSSGNLRKYHRDIDKSLREGDFGTLDKMIDSFRDLLNDLFSEVNRSIEKLVNEIDRITS